MSWLKEYADAGIPHYWLLELDDPITLTAFSLVDGGYKVVASGSGKVSPFPVVLHLPSPITGWIAALPTSRGRVLRGLLPRRWRCGPRNGRSPWCG